MGAAGARRRRRVGGRRTGGLAQGQPLGGVSRLAEPGGVTVKESLCSFTKDYSLSTFFGVNKWQTSKLVVSRYWISNCHIHNGIRTIAHLRAAIRLSTLCTGRGSANLGRFRAHKRATVPAAPPPTRSQLALGSCACHVAGGGGTEKRELGAGERIHEKGFCSRTTQGSRARMAEVEENGNKTQSARGGGEDGTTDTASTARQPRRTTSPSRTSSTRRTLLASTSSLDKVRSRVSPSSS
jgi:hypothetical protein